MLYVSYIAQVSLLQRLDFVLPLVNVCDVYGLNFRPSDVSFWTLMHFCFVQGDL